MEELLRRNASGELAPCPRTGGYLVDGKKRCGITTWLHRKLGLYGSARIKKKGKRRAPEPYTPARASSKRTGTAFHRQVHHSLFCSSRRCRCKRAFGTRTNTQSKKGTPCYDLVKQALQALLELRLKPVCAEQVIAAHDAPVATQFDLICRDEHKKTVLVSWKVRVYFSFLCCGRRAFGLPWDPHTPPKIKPISGEHYHRAHRRARPYL